MKASTLKYYVIYGLLCSVLPDFDLLYFYLIDHRQHAHHTYWTHIPIFWLLLTGALYFGTKAVLRKNIGLACVILLANTQTHLLLDSVAGGIYWLHPFNNEYYRLFEITARYDWWVWNYIIHWTFLFELLIIAATTYVIWEDRRLALAKTASQYNM
jgi:inner membrane protein